MNKWDYNGRKAFKMEADEDRSKNEDLFSPRFTRCSLAICSHTTGLRSEHVEMGTHNAKWTKHQCKQLKRIEGKEEKNREKRKRKEKYRRLKIADSVRSIAEVRIKRLCSDRDGGEDGDKKVTRKCGSWRWGMEESEKRSRRDGNEAVRNSPSKKKLLPSLTGFAWVGGLTWQNH